MTAALLKSPRYVETHQKCGGTFTHFGLLLGLTRAFYDNPSLAYNTTVNLVVNVDGV